jgi:uncharacterized protein with NAD-binding domain and iron-sulfur cluster
MSPDFYETVIVGAGISGLACAKKLSENENDFIIIDDKIGGRILTSKDENTNYGAFFICSDYHNFLKYATIKSRIKLSDFCFHKDNKTYKLYELSLIPYFIQFYKVKKLLYKFRKSLRILRQNSENISQKKAIENDSFLYKLYMQTGLDFVKKQKLMKGTEKYLSQALYSTTFSQISEMNAFSFLQFLIPLITPIYTFNFEKERIINSFKNRILKGLVNNIERKNDKYYIKTEKKIIHSKNIVFATHIDWSKKFLNIKKTNIPVATNMIHLRGIPRFNYTNKLYHLFTPPYNTQSIANLNDGTFLYYFKNKPPNLDVFFKDYEIIGQHYWNPAGTINGHVLIESNRGKNQYLIGDYNIAGLEESYITGIYAANQIIKSE